MPGPERCLMRCPRSQASTVGAAFLTKTLPDMNVKFEIWYVRRRHAQPLLLNCQGPGVPLVPCVTDSS